MQRARNPPEGAWRTFPQKPWALGVGLAVGKEAGRKSLHRHWAAEWSLGGGVAPGECEVGPGVAVGREGLARWMSDFGEVPGFCPLA